MRRSGAIPFCQGALVAALVAPPLLWAYSIAAESIPPSPKESELPGRFRPLVGGVLGEKRGAVEPANSTEAPHVGWLRYKSVSTSVAYADRGQVRVVVDDASKRNGKIEFPVEVRNEGQHDYSVSPKDRWFALVTGGKPTRLQADQKEALTLLPGESGRFRLSGDLRTGSTVSTMQLRSAFLDQDVEIREEFEDLRKADEVPAAYDPEAAPSTPLSVRVAAIVDPNGRVERVIDVLSNGEPTLDRYREAARKALGRWTFAPARQGDRAVRTVHAETFSFDNPRAFRAIVAGSASETCKRIEAIVRGKSGVVATIPPVGGFVVGQPLPADEDARWARALYVRCGAESEGSATWITATFSDPFREAKSADTCDCSWWEANEDGSAALGALERLVERIGGPPPRPVALTRAGGGQIPSGLPEPARNGNWDRYAVAHLLRWSIAAAGGTAQDAPAPSPEDLPPPDAFLRPDPSSADGGIPVSGAVKAPKLVHSVPPVYPEVARRARVTGRVILQAVINEDGEVENVDILRGSPLLNEAARRAVCCWKYEPATINDRRVRVYFTVVINFYLH